MRDTACRNCGDNLEPGERFVFDVSRGVDEQPVYCEDCAREMSTAEREDD